MTPEEYLTFEETSEVRHEYVAGWLCEMAGGSREHAEISVNVVSELRTALRGKPCRPYGSDAKVRITRAEKTIYYYPDVTVDCSGSRSAVIEEPTVIFEVLSPGTQRLDRFEKFLNYQTLASLRVYVLVDQKMPMLTVHRLGEDGVWTTEQIRGLEATLALPEIDCSLALSAVYENVLPAAGG